MMLCTQREHIQTTLTVYHNSHFRLTLRTELKSQAGLFKGYRFTS